MDNSHGPGRDGRLARMTSWRVVGLVVTAVVVVLTLLLPGGPAGAPRPSAPAPLAPTAPAQARGELATAAAVLASWDARRAAAWAADDPVALRGLYAARSRAAAADLRLLARWRDAGWRVTDLRSQVLAVTVVRATDDRMLLRVVDRVAGGRVVGRAGEAAAPLPGTTAVARLVDLRRRGPTWQVAASRTVRG